MIRSPEQQYALAKTLPLSELQKVVAGQSDIVDMWIADAVGRAKVKEIKAKQGMQAMQVAQGPKVAEKDMAEAQQMMLPQPRMEQGIAAMPADVEVPEYAGGGIVAFEDGGEVMHYAGEGPSFVQSASTPFGRGYESFAQSVGQAFYTPPEERLRRNLKNQLSIQSGFIGSFLPQTDEARANAKLLYDKIDTMSLDQLRALDAQMKEGRGLAAPVTAQTQAIGPDIKKAEAALAKQAEDIKQGKGPHVAGIAKLEADRAAAEKKATTDAKEQAGLAALTDSIINKYIPNRKALTPQEAIAQQKAFDIAYGVDPEIYNRARTELKKEQEGEAGARREAGWMRALEAGLGIMGGTSPYAFTNIGQGSKEAVKGIQEDIKDFRKLERDRRKELINLDVAENAFKKTGSDAARDAMFKSQEAVDRIAGKQADVASHIETARLQASGIAGYRSEALELERRKSAIELAISSLKNSTTLIQDTPEYNRAVMKLAAHYLQAMNKGELGGGTSIPGVAKWGKLETVKQ